MKSNVLGYPRIGEKRELKKANEAFWAGNSTEEELLAVAEKIRVHNWQLQKDAGVDFIPSNDFSFYDQMLDFSFVVGAIPERFAPIKHLRNLDRYFALARGYQKDGIDITAMEMTKWFDTNYHYIVPEFTKNQTFSILVNKPLQEYNLAKQHGFDTKPVLIGLVTYLLLGKEKEEGFNRLDLAERLLPVYIQLAQSLVDAGAKTIQIDEPYLVLDLPAGAAEVYRKVYGELKKQFTNTEFILTTYFGALDNNTELALSLPFDVFHIDLVRATAQLDNVLKALPANKKLSLGVVNGRNIWKNNFEHSLALIEKAKEAIGADRLLIATSCSLLHSPCNLELENNEKVLTPEIKQWLAFAKQKVKEVTTLQALATGKVTPEVKAIFEENKKAAENRKTSTLIHDNKVKERVNNITAKDDVRHSPFSQRKVAQHKSLNLPLFPTTTIGSFPQTDEVRSWRARFKKGDLTQAEYDKLLEKEIEESIRFQEDTQIDVLVHGEFERNDMVEYFGELLKGYTFTKFGWVQSYGSRCVKPPIIFGDISRPEPMTVRWSQYAQSLTKLPVKGMLTGPVSRY